MKNFWNHRRGVTALLLAIATTSSFASLAEAGHGGGRRYKSGYREVRVVRHAYRPACVHGSRGSYTVWRSGSGSAVAGFIGGLFLGATLANAAPVGYAYWDPYCHYSFASLEIYDQHCRAQHHGRSINVIEVPDGYSWDDYHVCDDCGRSYWGDDHDCDD